MKQHTRILFTRFVLAGVLVGVTACQQAPAPLAAAPAETNAAPPPPQVVVVEEAHPQGKEEDRSGVSVGVDIHKQQDGDHATVDLHARP